MKIFLSAFVLSIMVFTYTACNNNNSDNNEATENNTTPAVPAISYNIVAAYPHDTSSFTEGLLIYNGKMYESAGNWKKSKLLELDLKTGQPIKQIPLADKYFGEGIAILHDTLYQMTYKEHMLFMYTLPDLKKIKELPLDIEGWGMTTDSKNLIASNGTSNLYFYEPSTFRLLHTQGVTENGSPVININELEYVNGYIYANQWMYPYILKIDPNSGQVVGKLDLTDLINRVQTKIPNLSTKDNAVLNGIAYDAATKKMYVTGKLWPEVYEITFPF